MRNGHGGRPATPPREGSVSGDAAPYPTAAERERLVLAVLDAHPDATVAAADETGVFAAASDELARRGHAALEGRGAIEHIVAADRAAMLRAWERCRQTGSEQVVTELVTGEQGTFWFVDVRERFGAHVVILVRSPLADGREHPAVTIGGPVPPRHAITYRNDQAAFIAIDDAVTGMLGWTLEELQGALGLDLIHPDDQDRALENWIEMLTNPDVPHRWRGRHRRRDGSWLWIEFTTHNELAQHGYVRSELYDISGEMAAVDALQDRERLLREIAEALPVGVVRLTLDGSVVYANRRSRELFGVEAIGGMSDLLASVPPAHRDDLALAIEQAASGLGESHVHIGVPQAAGTVRHLDCRVRRLQGRLDDEEDAVLSVVDVSESVRLRQELQRRADTDGLTGVLSRSATLARIDEAAASTAVVYLDLDRFKEVNDRYGHAAGDAVLCSVVSRLSTAVEGRGRVGRVGGDEFVVIAEVPDVAAAKALAEACVQVTDHEVPCGDVTLRVRASVGVAWTDDASREDADDIVARADRAMYRAKERGSREPVLATS